jgi:restriction endonuclease S subunit
MKDSGIEWIGKIPETWKILPHKRIMRKTKEICFTYNNEDIISLTTNGVIIRDLSAGGKMPTTFDGYQYVHPGNLLMCLFDIDVTPRCVGLIRNEGLTSPAYSQFKFVRKDAYPPYFDYLLRYMDDEKCLLHLSKNLRSSLTEEDFGFIYTILPPFREQQRIVSYLNEKCGEIDMLIGLQEQMIEKLKAYKQSIITEAITKGLNPNAKLVPSGIDWIGEIPEGWTVLPVKRICKKITDGSHFSPNTIGEGKPYITVSNVYDDKIHVENAAKISLDDFTALVANGCQPPKGAVLLAKDGTVGRTAVVYDNDYVVLSSLGILTPSDKLLSKYLKYLLDSDSLQAQMQLSMAGSALRRITISKICKFIGLLPPLSEQHSIASYLDEKCADIDRLIALKQQKIEKLKDYKKSVIYEAVTGKTIIE